MAEAEEERGPPSEEQQLSSSAGGGPEDTQPTGPAEGTEERAAEVAAARPRPADLSVEPSLHQFKTRRFFVLRVKTSTFPLDRQLVLPMADCNRWTGFRKFSPQVVRNS